MITETKNINVGSPEENIRLLVLLNDLDDGPLLRKYIDQQITKALKEHDSKIGYSKPEATAKQFELYKMAVGKCLELGIDYKYLDLLQLRFKDEEDINNKLDCLKTKNRKIFGRN